MATRVRTAARRFLLLFSYRLASLELGEVTVLMTVHLHLMPEVVSAFAPVERRRFGHPASRSGRLQDAEGYRGSAHVLPTPRCRGNMLAHAGPAAQEVSELVVAAAIAPR